MSDAYSLLAPIYQPLSRLVFGRDLIYANQAFLEGIIGKKLLIIGGGDGAAYREFRGNMQGEFWDKSPSMTQLASRNLATSGLTIRTGTWPGIGKFDRIYLPFVLDTLTDLEIEEILFQVWKSLNVDGQVIISDFYTPQTYLQRLIQGMMIVSFRILVKHLRNDLPNISENMKAAGFSIIREKIWRHGWIRAQVYERSLSSLD